MKVIPREAQAPATNSTMIRSFRSSLSLSDEQRCALIGALLGDASLVANSWKRHYRLQIEQSYRQRDYVFWKYDIFKTHTLSAPSYQERNQSWRFRTISHPEFTEVRNVFYPQGKKIVPNNIDELLTHPLSLAVWYMDDGMLTTRHDAFVMNTQSFSWASNVLLQKCLARNFGVEATIVKNKSYWMLHINKKYAPIFWQNIEKYVTTIMSEKLPVAL